MDLNKLEEANRIKSLIEGAESSVERGKALFNAKELCIMDKKEGRHTYINGAEKDAIEKIVMDKREAWLKKWQDAFDAL